MQAWAAFCCGAYESAARPGGLSSFVSSWFAAYQAMQEVPLTGHDVVPQPQPSAAVLSERLKDPDRQQRDQGKDKCVLDQHLALLCHAAVFDRSSKSVPVKHSELSDASASCRRYGTTTDSFVLTLLNTRETLTPNAV